jgi:hypothetical protein
VANQDPPTFTSRHLCQLQKQPRLPNARLAGEQRNSAAPLARIRESLHQQAQLALPTDQSQCGYHASRPPEGMKRTVALANPP